MGMPRGVDRVGEGERAMRTNLPAVIEDGPLDARYYALAANMLLDYPHLNCRENRGLLATAMWMEAKNTLAYILEYSSTRSAQRP
jgi:hypothetical protein